MEDRISQEREALKHWYREVNWPYLRWFVVYHVAMWALALGLAIASHHNLLFAERRTLAGIVAIAAFAMSLVGTVPLFGHPNLEDDDGAGLWQFPISSIVLVFLTSSGGYLSVLTSLNLDAVELW